MARLAAPINSDGYGKTTLGTFAGYNAAPGAGDGAIVGMENMASDWAPWLGTRYKRRTILTGHTARGACGAFDRTGDFSTAYWVESDGLYRLTSARAAERVASFTASAGKHKLATIGDYVVVWPEKKYFLASTESSGSLEAEVTVSGARLCSFAGTYADTQNAMELTLTSCPFSAGDAIEISGCVTHEENNKSAVIREIFTENGKTYLVFDDYTFTLAQHLEYTVPEGGLPTESGSSTYTAITLGDRTMRGGKYWKFDLSNCQSGESGRTRPYSLPENTVIKIPLEALVAGTGVATAYLNGTSIGSANAVQGEPAQYLTFSVVDDFEGYTESGNITLTRTVPDAAVLFGHDNRLWIGEGDTIWCSALGNPFNWMLYDGVSTDSWTVETGTDGDFTGGCSYAGYPRFFKDGHVFTVYGGYPAEYQVTKYDAPGVMAGCEDGIAAAGGYLFYFSRSGMQVYSGSLPSAIGAELGVEEYSGAVAGTDGRKVYIRLEDSAGDANLFVYDTRSGVWSREDDTDAVAMARCGEALLVFTSDGKILEIGRPILSAGTEESSVSWSAEWGDLLDGSVDTKHVVNLRVRLELDSGSAKIYTRFEGDASWTEQDEITGTGRKSVTIPIIQRRYDAMNMKISGTGAARIIAIEREVSAGSDRRSH